MDNRETLTPSSGDVILKRHLFSEVARNLIKGRGHIERAYFVRRPSRQSFGFRVAASSGPIPKAPGSAGGYLLALAPETSCVLLKSSFRNVTRPKRATYRKSRSRASSTICSADKTPLINSPCGAVCISYR